MAPNKMVMIIFPKSIPLVDGFIPSEKYACEFGSFTHVGVKIYIYIYLKNETTTWVIIKIHLPLFGGLNM